MSEIPRAWLPVLAPSVRVVLGHRGYGKTFLAGLLTRAVPWCPADTKGYYCVDVGVDDNPDVALKHAADVDRMCRNVCPGVQTRVFMRAEHWEQVKHLKSHNWLMRAPEAIWSMPARTRTWYGEAIDTAKCIDSRGYVVAAAALSNPVDWVQQQPEHCWLHAALPLHEDADKIAVHLAVSRMSSYLDRHPDTYTAGCKTPREFLDHCELIGAGKRVGSASWEWSPLWLHGVRELNLHSM